jgi:dienelactone hydrolase
MKAVSLITALFLTSGFAHAFAEEKPIASTEYLPPSGKGRVVVMISGLSGPTDYVPIAREIAKSGYYAVLVDGNDIWRPGGTKDLMTGVIVHAQQSPNALPGKVGVVAFSLGGGPALAYAANEPDLVAAVVAFYPLTNYITDPTGFVATRIKVPTIVLAGVRDTYKGCCLIDMARKLAAAAKAGGQPLVLTEYPDANHGFNLAGANFRQKDAADGFSRTLAHLQKYLAPAKS